MVYTLSGKVIAPFRAYIAPNFEQSTMSFTIYEGSMKIDTSILSLEEINTLAESYAECRIQLSYILPKSSANRAIVLSKMADFLNRVSCIVTNRDIYGIKRQ